MTYTIVGSIQVHQYWGASSRSLAECMFFDGIWEGNFVDLHGCLFTETSLFRQVLFDRWLEMEGITGGINQSQIANFRKRSYYFKTDPLARSGLTLYYWLSSEGNAKLHQVETVTDDYGHFLVRIAMGRPGPSTQTTQAFISHGMKHSIVQLGIGGGMGGGASEPEGAGAGASGGVPGRLTIVSDIDDTIKITEVLDKRAMLRNTFLNEFKSVAGMEDAFRAFKTRHSVKFIYLSSSPWQLHPSLKAFLENFPDGWNVILQKMACQDVPSLVEFLRDSSEYKIGELRRIFASGGEFVLIGDEGERDPEIYDQISIEHKHSVKAICIRRLRTKDDDHILTRFHPQNRDRVIIFSDGGELKHSMFNA